MPVRLVAAEDRLIFVIESFDILSKTSYISNNNIFKIPIRIFAIQSLIVFLIMKINY